MIDGYSHVLYRAWRGTAGDHHHAVEQVCIQVTMQWPK